MLLSLITYCNIIHVIVHTPPLRHATLCAFLLPHNILLRKYANVSTMVIYLLDISYLVILAVLTLIFLTWVRRKPKTRQSGARHNGPRAPIQMVYPGLGNEDVPAEIEYASLFFPPPVKLLKTSASIVAVHGLGSNVDWSWTWQDKTSPGSSVNWLSDSDMLPAVVPNARILVYNYYSRWHINAPKTRLQLCGEELVHSLHDFRQGLHDRPIIFVGHSLGGLVIQHVCVEFLLFCSY